MTDEQINIAIAESLGFYLEGDKWYKDQGVSRTHYASGIKCYTSDLNAIHEAVNSLSGGQYVNWVFELEKICGMPVGYNATARQRCEAYLRTIGKWIE